MPRLASAATNAVWTRSSSARLLPIHRAREGISTIEDLDGLSATNPVVAFSLATFLLSLAGIPPLPGFWGKLSLAMAALEVDWTAQATPGSRRVFFLALAVILVINAAIAAAYYLRIVAAMYFRSAKRGVQADGGLGAGIAMLAFLYYNIQGIKAQGGGYIKQFTGPIWWLTPLMLPIDIVSHAARPVSLTIRLFANMFAGEQVTLVFLSLTYIVVPVAFMGLHVFISVIQAYVFALLTLIYVGAAISEEH